MANQEFKIGDRTKIKFKVGDRVKITDFTGTIVGTKLEDNSIKYGDLVVDFCCGSGTIPKAAQLEHRNYIGIDNGVCERKGKFEGWYWADIAKYRLKNMNK